MADPNHTDEEQYDADEQLTGEVGSEGGSPGETVVVRSGAKRVARGSEATETAPRDRGNSETAARLGEQGQPLKRNP